MTTKVILTIKFEALIEIADGFGSLPPQEMMDDHIMKRILHPRELRRLTDMVDTHVCRLAQTSSQNIRINNPSVDWQYLDPQEGP